MVWIIDVVKVFGILTILGQLGIIALILDKKFDFLKKYKKNFKLYAFIVALVATLGSLFLSEIAGWTPCELCWYQRIFMYPQVIVLGMGLLKKRNTAYINVPLSIIGAVFAAYHTIIQMQEISTGCATDGVACTTKYFTFAGYITIPVMALTAFLLISLLLYRRRKVYK